MSPGARLGTGVGLPPLRAAALARLRKAVAGHPFMLAGTGRFDTRITEIFRERVFLKTGAEGVYCGSLPELGLGFAVKCDDGATRAAEVVTAKGGTILVPPMDVPGGDRVTVVMDPQGAVFAVHAKGR